MLEHVPGWLGAMLRGVRAGGSKLVIVQPELGSDFATIALSSPAFADRARLPERFTADGAGVSPPLVWGEVPEGTRSLALIVEDPDAPAPHAAEPAAGIEVGRNSYMSRGWLPPDPPTGHGTHDYVFQLFALAETDPVDEAPGRGDVVSAIAGKVLAAGMLVGTYSRGEPAPVNGGRRALA